MTTLNMCLQLILAIAPLVIAIINIAMKHYQARLVLLSMPLKVRVTAESAVTGLADCTSADLGIVRVLDMLILIEVQRRLVLEIIEGVDLEIVFEHWIRIGNHG